MKFKAKDSSADLSIIKGRIYFGHLIYISTIDPGLRIVIFNKRREWATYNPKMFEPFTEEE